MEHLFYDGDCGLCHRWVLFALRREGGRELFRYAPLQGPTFARLVPEEERRRLPDSIVVRTAQGALLVRSAAALHVLARLGGGWAALARVARLVPRALRDFVYDRVAAVRKRLFARPEGACPLVPPELARRFDP
ncbi:MAG TPA: DCC1-like thiol-disulfide oxidoreductase family protein [Planctomycetota bacterium]